MPAPGAGHRPPRLPGPDRTAFASESCPDRLFQIHAVGQSPPPSMTGGPPGSPSRRVRSAATGAAATGARSCGCSTGMRRPSAIRSRWRRRASPPTMAAWSGTPPRPVRCWRRRGLYKESLLVQLVYDTFDAAANVNDALPLAVQVPELDKHVRKAGQFKQPLSVGLTYTLCWRATSGRQKVGRRALGMWARRSSPGRPLSPSRPSRPSPRGAFRAARRRTRRRRSSARTRRRRAAVPSRASRSSAC